MPTNQTRRRCSFCKARRVEKYMKVHRFKRCSNIAVWICDTSKLNELINCYIRCDVTEVNGHPRRKEE